MPAAVVTVSDVVPVEAPRPIAPIIINPVPSPPAAQAPTLTPTPVPPVVIVRPTPSSVTERLNTEPPRPAGQ